MTTFDFTPLYRSTIGFDHLASLLDSVSSKESGATGYPPYNIELLDEDQYRITMAVAGFVDKDVSVEVENQTLTVAADKDEKGSARTYLHQGIAERNFKRQFRLADYIRVVGASLENGLLHVDLQREVPEAMKPRKIAVNGKDGKLLKSS